MNNLFKSLFLSRLTKNPMIGLAWWLWGKTPANLFARSAFALVCLTAFNHRRQIMKILEDPLQTFTDYIKATSPRSQKNHKSKKS